MYIAHIRKTDNEEQTVNEHCRGVSRKCVEAVQGLEVGNIAALEGLLHDMGKMTARFERYIRGES
jgi:CRISPR-associated endonuclease/helicase Cas3